jgi:hypothetical protein
VQHWMVVNMAGLRSLVGGGVTRMGEVGDHAIAGNPQVVCGMKRIDGECTWRLVALRSTPMRPACRPGGAASIAEACRLAQVRSQIADLIACFTRRPLGMVRVGSCV